MGVTLTLARADGQHVGTFWPSHFVSSLLVKYIHFCSTTIRRRHLECSTGRRSLRKDSLVVLIYQCPPFSRYIAPKTERKHPEGYWVLWQQRRIGVGFASDREDPLESHNQMRITGTES